VAGTDLLTRADGLRAGRVPFVLATVVRAERPTSAKAGDRALVLADGTIEGFVGGSCAESTVRVQGLRLLDSGESTLLRITPAASDTEAAVEGLVTVGNPCLSGGTLEIFLEAMLPPMLVHVFGTAPVARALVGVGAAAGYEMRASTDPGEPITPDTAAVVVASHGRDEEPVLTAALRAGVRYVGLVASRRRGSAVLAGLDLPDEQKARVRTPAGLDIGARTAAEIALSIYAEIVASRPRVAQPPPPQPPPPRSGDDTADGAGAGRTRAPAEVVDPVCGMTVPAADGTRHLQHAGRTWYFCGSGCQRAFVDEPDRYPGH
jgi:xanthine dehydrogenase accessory factor